MCNFDGVSGLRATYQQAWNQQEQDRLHNTKIYFSSYLEEILTVQPLEIEIEIYLGEMVRKAMVSLSWTRAVGIWHEKR